MPNNVDLNKLDTIIDEVLHVGSYSDKRHTMSVEPGYVIWVKDRSTGVNVAYSSTKADFEQSLAEFAADYFLA